MIPAYRDLAHLELIIELIGHLKRRLHDLSYAQFAADRDEVDLTAFRLAAIGEATHNLSEGLKSRNSGIPWRDIYDMRNVISHDYGAIIASRVWAVLGEPLADLSRVCDAELARMVSPSAGS